MDKSFQNRVERWAWAVPSAMTLAVLAACGGGSDSGDVSAATVTPAAITSQPNDQSVASAGSASFSVGADGSGARIQWQLSTDGGLTWSNVAGATGSTLSLSNVTAAQNGDLYRAVVSASDGSTATSAPVTLRVEATVTPPVITAHATSARAIEGGTASFSVTATGAGLRYQWQVSTDGSTWADVANATEATLTLSELPLAADGRSYRVTVTNSAGSTTSAPVTLQVQAATAQPQVLSGPAAVAVVAPATATFTASVAGSPTPTLQWQRSGDSGSSWVDIAGATAATYTTPATSTADSGTLYRVVATNSVDSAVSDSARLTVTASSTAPSITTQPSAATASVGGQATFTVAGTGTPAPTVQWQVSTDGTTWTNIAGANASSYATGAVSLSDSGRRYRALLTNSQGSTPSNAVLLTVTPLTSLLSGRAWTTGAALEANDQPVEGFSAAIDDSGRVMVLFVKSDGSRKVLWAVRGEPGATGAAPTFTSPLALDATLPVASSEPYRVVAAPGGDMLATWISRQPCTSSSYNTSGNCLYRYAARFVAANNTWEAPIQVASTRSTTLGNVMLNDQGDMLVEVTGWTKVSGSLADTDATVTWKGRADSSFRQQNITGTNLGTRRQFLDGDGNLLLVGQASQNATTDIVAYRGTVTGGIGNQEIIDTRGAAATFRDAWMGRRGHVVVMWNQNNGTADTRYAATLDRAGDAWTLAQLNIANEGTSPRYAAVNDDGSFTLYSNGLRLIRRSGIWGNYARFSDWGFWNEYYADFAMSRNGNMLVVKNGNLLKNNGWASFDGNAGAVVQPFPTDATGPGYLLGVKSELAGHAYLSQSGVGFFLSINTFDVLPTAAVPSGDKRTVDNLWGFYFK